MLHERFSTDLFQKEQESTRFNIEGIMEHLLLTKILAPIYSNGHSALWHDGIYWDEYHSMDNVLRRTQHVVHTLITLHVSYYCC